MSEIAPSRATPAPGALIFAALFLAGALALFSQLGAETAFSAKGKLVAQPAFWPAIGVGGMVLFALGHLVGLVCRGVPAGGAAEAAVWLRSGEYLAWFMVYVFAVPVAGYLPSTLAFAVALALRAGYRGRRQLVAAALTGLAIVLTFKTLLAVKIPGGAAYEHLPKALRSAAILYF